MGSAHKIRKPLPSALKFLKISTHFRNFNRCFIYISSQSEGRGLVIFFASLTVETVEYLPRSISSLMMKNDGD